MTGDSWPRWRVGDRLNIKGVTVTVSELDAVWLPRIRDHLIGVAARGTTSTYGALKTDLCLPHAINGLGRLLDLLGEDCARRDEPSLAALVVSQTTGEVGADFQGDAAALRQLVYRRWPRPESPDRLDDAHHFTLNGTQRSLAAEPVRARLRGATPDTVRTHWVDIEDRRFPPKQALRTALDLGQDEPFVTHFAIRVFRRVGFETSALPDEHRAEPTLPVAAGPPEAPSPTAPQPLLTAEDAILAFQRLDDFLGAAPLTASLAQLEVKLDGATGEAAAAGRRSRVRRGPR